MCRVEKHGRSQTGKHQESVPLHQRRTKEEEKGSRRTGEEESQSSDHGRRRRSGTGIQPGHQGQGIHRAGRTFRLRQVDDAAHGGRSGRDQRRRAVHRREADERCGTEGPRHRDGLPELRPVPAHDRVRQHGLLPEAASHPERRDRQEGARGCGDPGHHTVPGAQAEGAVGRPETARGHRPRDRARPEGDADGRASVEPGREAA